MISARSLASLALAIPALAIPPPDFGFPEAPNDTALAVRFQNPNVLVQEAALYGIGITQNAPSLSVNTSDYQSLADYNGNYTVLMVDPDASYPQNPNRRFILHWMQANLAQSSNATSNATLGGRALQNSTAPVVPYMRPSPPTNSSAHRYIIYAFQQPSNFSVPPQWSGLSGMNRTNFNLTNFISDARLGTPAAANYFYVSNQTSVPANFTAAPGGSYPGGNGDAVTSGDPYSQSTTSTSSSTSSAAAAAMITGAGSLLGAGIVGMAAFL
ncbi:hypothetical protein M409DRAFT_63264 [Zasmidium cellare ATCC 36951]|uniref:PEBP-like protein n=1 Tax=Zasmidium cellare ATCC 36951 TaxID=1080233 RepID=A0A6A6CWQ0_ZASCE|nr:uncharacterized protein M409DRAFT_63264 [Zasmidium cellare ATCC 36951]KAF2171627.1 hypothetical protein M409DRAFT_63264 [Zasmidium cellare ATCC 36951]